mgnify:CR=1 FL=1
MPRLPEHSTPMTPDERRDAMRDEAASGFDFGPEDEERGPDLETIAHAARATAYYEC